MSQNTIPAIQDVIPLIKKEARILMNKMGVNSRMDFDDAVSEGLTRYYYVRSVFKPDKGMKFTSLLVMDVKQHFTNILQREMPRIAKTYNNEEVLGGMAQRRSTRIQPDDIHIHEDLSSTAQAFLECIFSPPPELESIKDAAKGSSWIISVKRPIMQFLGLDSEGYKKVVEELRKKAFMSV